MQKEHKILWMWGLLAALFFIPFLGRVHLFDWDEINFAECAREMILTGNYLQPQIDFKAFYEKPPLFFWLQAISMKIWGIGEFGARFPNAICGVLTLLMLYKLGKKLFTGRLGMLWAAAYLGSLLPHLYFKSGIIDPWFNLFIFFSLYQFILFYWQHTNNLPDGISARPKHVHLLFSSLGMALAILTKGPAAVLIFGLSILAYWAYKRGKLYVRPISILILGGISLLICGLWFGIESALHGPTFLKEFIVYQYRLFSTPDAGHGGFPGFHIAVLLIGCFPASVFAVRAFFIKTDASPQRQDFKRWMQILFWVVLILFSIVQSKIIHYSSLCYFPLTFLAALAIDQLWEGKIKWRGWLVWGTLSIGLLWGIMMMAAPFLGRNIDLIEPLIKDPSGKASLAANVYWSGWEGLVGFFQILIVAGSVYLFHRSQWRKACILLFGGGALFVWLVLAFYVKKIEAYSQAAPIAFFESLEDTDAYIFPMHYKTYAHLFYTRKQIPMKPEPSLGKRVYEQVDKEVYISTKIHKAPLLRDIKGLLEIKSENGFVFFYRANNSSDSERSQK